MVDLLVVLGFTVYNSNSINKYTLKKFLPTAAFFLVAFTKNATIDAL